MQGTVLTFHPETNTGLISGYDGTRYTFSRADWTTPNLEPQQGLTVDFDGDGKKALQIIVIESKATFRKAKTKSAAILWCLFLGGIGAHKFYLRQTSWGVIYLLFFWTLIPVLVSFVETIMLILMSESEFNRRYNY
jgi:TM2 domain-containing membrane protein YozV